jgi:formylglycine-generating enzyme
MRIAYRVAFATLAAIVGVAAPLWLACGGAPFDAAGPDAGPSDAASPDVVGVVEDAHGGRETTPPGEAGLSNDGAVPSTCPSGRGPSMVDVGPFCIDATEVTTAQYNTFLLAGPSLSDQRSECAWNTSFLPGNGWTYDPARADYPIANVDWCDAFAFCKWAGKRLCGKIDGGVADFNDFGAISNEHYYACSAAATRVYPYGNTLDPSACNGVELDAGGPLPVGSLTRCQGGVPRLFDMSGNVEEWQNFCQGDGGPTDQCLDGTGAFDFGGTRCDFRDSDNRGGSFPDVGIRCCAR